MTIDIRGLSQAITRVVLVTGLVLLTMILPVRALAALGGDVGSVEADQQKMNAKRAVQTNGNYSVHEISTSYGSVVREYVSPDGKVFGVAWRGPFLPDFQQLLGGYYAQYSQGAQDARAAQMHSRRAPLIVDRPDLVMFSGGHERFYAGHAYVPGMIPKGVDAKEIR